MGNPHEELDKIILDYLHWVPITPVSPDFFGRVQTCLARVVSECGPHFYVHGHRTYRVTGFQGVVTNSALTVYPQLAN